MGEQHRSHHQEIRWITAAISSNARFSKFYVDTGRGRNCASEARSDPFGAATVARSQTQLTNNSFQRSGQEELWSWAIIQIASTLKLLSSPLYYRRAARREAVDLETYANSKGCGRRIAEGKSRTIEKQNREMSAENNGLDLPNRFGFQSKADRPSVRDIRPAKSRRETTNSSQTTASLALQPTLDPFFTETHRGFACEEVQQDIIFRPGVTSNPGNTILTGRAFSRVLFVYCSSGHPATRQSSHSYVLTALTLPNS